MNWTVEKFRRLQKAVEFERLNIDQVEHAIHIYGQLLANIRKVDRELGESSETPTGDQNQYGGVE